MTPIRDNVMRVRDAIAAAAVRSGRDPGAVTLVAVSKKHPAESVMAALEAGITHLGENRVQEAEAKIPAVAGEAVWHLVGHLQSNKAGRAAGLFHWIDSVDSKKVADRLSAAAFELGRTLRVLIQVNVSGESAKSGAAPEDARELAVYAAGLESLDVRGLMTIGSLGVDEAAARVEFARMRELFQALRADPALASHMRELSMGMSGDFEAAIEEGATMVRVGTAIFGERRT